ncbi:hypothetical protein ACGRHY_18135 [Streptomyces sp. HK10]|uniref:hypothetical protein n=1 Tax=Streptomyces sp. HK10 TaxID=3373255 RepID=UPI003747BB16
MGSRSNRSRRYSEEFERDAVAPVHSSGRTVTETAVGNGCWERCPGADCNHSGAPASIRVHRKKAQHQVPISPSPGGAGHCPDPPGCGTTPTTEDCQLRLARCLI